jgi:8-oxo-dGTP diphosphatase
VADNTTEAEVVKVFGNRLRLRVCGLCIENNSILLVRHHSLGEKGVLWAPPGGGLQFNESAKDTLKREFMEETGVEVEIGSLVFVNEFLELPLHAIELFFEVNIKSGVISRGTDPEMGKDHQIINKVAFVGFEELKKMDPVILHHVLRMENPENIMESKGYYLNGKQ